MPRPDHSAARARTNRGALIAVVLALALAVATPAQAQVMDNMLHAYVGVEELEMRNVGPDRPVFWDVVSWFGGDFNRLWVRSAGSRATTGSDAEISGEVLAGRLIAPFWDLLVGVRFEARTSGAVRATRPSAVIALEGLAPYRFRLEPSMYVSTDGDVAAEITASYDVWLTQRLLIQPRADLHAALQAVPAFDVTSGINDAGVGLRLRYEVRRELAPYVGVQWNARVGRSGTLHGPATSEPSGATAVFGVRAWF